MDEKKHADLIERKRKEYKSFVPIFSSALKEWVFFNAKGFNHLLSKQRGVPREIKEQIYKLGLLSFAVPIINQAKIIESHRVIKQNRRIIMEYWSVVGILGKAKVKVVIRRIGNKGKLHFWSLMRIK